MSRLRTLLNHRARNSAKNAKSGTGYPARLSGAGGPARCGFAWVGKFGLVAILSLAGCRQDMHDQPRYKPLGESDFYPDLRAGRTPVEGTVARGQLHEDAYLYSGKMGNDFGNYMPFPVTQADLSRGQERYDIYCAPCHSRVGDGNGMIPQRGYRHPPTYHQDRLRKAPLGYFFDVMTNGFGAMPSYAEQIQDVKDRWRIAAYIRALQLSQNATQADAGGAQIPSQPKLLEEPGSGATPPVEVPEPEGAEQK